MKPTISVPANSAPRGIVVALAASFCLLSCYAPANAQDVATTSPAENLAAEVAADFDALFSDIEQQEVDFAAIQARAATSDGLTSQVLESRGDRLWAELFRSVLALARDIADRRDAGQDVSAYEARIGSVLSTIGPQAIVAIQRSRSRSVFPTTSVPTEEFVLEDQKLFRHVRVVDELYGSLHDFVLIAQRFDVDETAALNFMVGTLADTAANRSIFLDLAIEETEALRASVTTLPNSTELADRLNVAEARVRLTTNAMQEVITLMNLVGLESRQYRQQLLTVTGEITTDVLDVGVMSSLIAEWSQSLFELLASEGPRLLFRLFLVIGIIFAFVQLSRLVKKGVERGLRSGRFQISHLLSRMIVSTAKNLVIMLGLLLAISQLGISLGPLLAGLGIAGFIVGFALQDALANFASGILILLYRPFDVEDVVEAGGVSGKVSHMSLVNTTFLTFDNQKLVVPNNMIWSSVITNLTAQVTRRVDLVFGISYSDDIEKAEAIFHDVVSNYPAVLDDPEPLIKVHELGDSSVNFIVRPWVRTEDYWDTYWDLTKQVKLRLDREGISIPFPQRDVHIVEQPV